MISAPQRDPPSPWLTVHCFASNVQSMITVESTDAEIHVTIPRGELGLEQVEAILRPFRFTSLMGHSQMSKAEAAQLAEESKADWWANNQHRFSDTPR